MDGHTNEILVNMTGTVGAKAVTGISNSVMLHFYTDSVYEGSGWHMKWNRKLTYQISSCFD